MEIIFGLYPSLIDLRLRAGLADMRKVLEEVPLPDGTLRAVDWDRVETAAGLDVDKGRVAVRAIVCAMSCVIAW